MPASLPGLTLRVLLEPASCGNPTHLMVTPYNPALEIPIALHLHGLPEFLIDQTPILGHHML